VQAEGGKNLRYQELDSGYLLVLVPGQEIMQSLTDFQSIKKIKFATVTGLGDVEKVQISHFNTTTMEMDNAPFIKDSNEMSSLTCSMATFLDLKSGGKTPIPHCHINVGLSSADDNRVVGGHLLSAYVSVVAELFITTSSHQILKTFDKPYNGKLFDLNLLRVAPVQKNKS